MKKPGSKPKTEKGMPAIHQMAVERLAHGLKPVQTPTPPLVQWLSWLAITAVMISVFSFLMPLRADLSINLKSIPFDLMLLFIFVGAASLCLGCH